MQRILRPAATVSGHTISGSVSGALLPSTGFAKSDDTWNLWPRIGRTNNAISDSAPDAMNLAVAAAPEPASCVLMGPASIGFVLALNGRRNTREPLAATGAMRQFIRPLCTGRILRAEDDGQAHRLKSPPVP